MPDEYKTPSDEIEMTPEQAIELLKKFDFSVPFYYTREKRRDPFLEMRDRKGKEQRRRGWRFWSRSP